MLDSEMIMLAIVLPNIGGELRPISRRVIGTSKDTVDTILIQNIGVEEYADSSSRDRDSVTLVVSGLLLAGRGAD
jgi:hypothetical protein